MKLSNLVLMFLLIANFTCGLIIYIKKVTINKVTERISDHYYKKNIMLDSIKILRNHDNYLSDLSNKYKIIKALRNDIPDYRAFVQYLDKDLKAEFDSIKIQKMYELSPKLCIEKLKYGLGSNYIYRGYDIGLYLSHYKGIKEKDKHHPYLIQNFIPFEASLSINGKKYSLSEEFFRNNEKLSIQKSEFKNLNDAKCYIKVNAIAEKLLESKIVWVKDDGSFEKEK